MDRTTWVAMLGVMRSPGPSSDRPPPAVHPSPPPGAHTREPLLAPPRQAGARRAPHATTSGVDDVPSTTSCPGPTDTTPRLATWTGPRE